MQTVNRCFCGSVVEQITIQNVGSLEITSDEWRVVCPFCKRVFTKGHSCKEEAISAWETEQKELVAEAAAQAHDAFTRLISLLELLKYHDLVMEGGTDEEEAFMSTQAYTSHDSVGATLAFLTDIQKVLPLTRKPSSLAKGGE